jgi:hypothetical protein
MQNDSRKDGKEDIYRNTKQDFTKMNTKKDIEILNSLSIAEKKKIGVRYIVLECKICHKHFGLAIKSGKISEKDMTCRNCKK